MPGSDTAAVAPELPDVTVGDPPPGHPTVPARTANPAVGVAVATLVAAGPYLYELGRLRIAPHRRVFLYGDVALEELSARDVLTGHQLLGPYSLFGWHHPGPSLFYLFALPVRMFASNGLGIFLATTLIDAVVVGAVVVFVGRRAGPAAAVVTAGALALLHVYLGAELLRDGWNPFVIVLPMVLFIVLAAGAAGGSSTALCWAAVVGSFEVQTHISTGPVAVAVLIVAGGGLALTRRRARCDRLINPSAVAGTALLVAMWLPPLVDAVHHHPSNLQLIWRFFTASHPVQTLGEGVRTALGAATVVPFGNRADAAGILTRSDARSVLAVAAFALLVVGTLVAGRRRGQRFGSWLAVMTVVGLGASMAANTRVVGPVYSWLVTWQAFVPVTLLIAVGCSLFGVTSAPAPPPAAAAGPLPGRHLHSIRQRPQIPGTRLWAIGVAVVAVLALAASADTVKQTVALAGPASDQGHPSSTEPTVAVATRLVERTLAPGQRTVRITIDTQQAWPLAAGLSLELERDGRRTTVAGTTTDWPLLFGAVRRPTGRENVDIELYVPGPGEQQGQPPAGTPIGRAGTVVVYLNQMG